MKVWNDKSVIPLKKGKKVGYGDEITVEDIGKDRFSKFEKKGLIVDREDFNKSVKKPVGIEALKAEIEKLKAEPKKLKAEIEKLKAEIEKAKK